MIRPTWRALVAIFLLACTHARADVDVSEYQTRQAVRSETEARRLRAILDREEEAAAQRARLAQDTEAQRLAAEGARLAARPWPQRLTEERCTLCHSASNYATGGHTLPGWWAVILRMRYINQAPVTWGDHWTIALHLAENHPADAETVAYEWGTPLAGLLCVVWLGFHLRKSSNNRKET